MKTLNPNAESIVENGKPTAFIMPIAEYEDLLEGVHDLGAIALRKDDPTISLAGVKRRLKPNAGLTLMTPREWIGLLSVFAALISGLSAVRATPPSLEATSGAPAGMVIVRDAVTLKLKNPLIKYQLYTAKAFAGIGDRNKNLVGWTLQAVAITPAGPSFTDSFGQKWYDVTPGSGSNELILSSSMSGLLTQSGIAQNQVVTLGRWAVSELRNTTPQPLSVAGRNVEFAFSVMCYTPSGATANGGILELSKQTLKLSFPIAGVAMQSVTAVGNLATETFISPYNFSQSVTSTHDVLTPTSVMTAIRPWIWGQFSTFNLAGWDLAPSTSLSGPLAVRDAWRRSFRNLTDFVTETSTGSRPLGHRLSDFPDTSQAASPFFISGGAITTDTVTNQLHVVAASTAQSFPWPYNEELIFHAAPSLSTSGGGGTQSNLTPYNPTGWSDRIVVSNTPDATSQSASDTSQLRLLDTLYVSWAVVNNGSQDITTPFGVELFVDGVAVHTWPIDPPLHSNFFTHQESFAIGSLSEGAHDITIRADSGNAIAETDETDNEYTKTITVAPGSSYQPDLLIGTSVSNLIGDGKYDFFAAGQIFISKLARGKTKTYFVQVQNDGSETNTFRIHSYGKKPGFKVRFLDGKNDITSQAGDGEYLLNDLAPNEIRNIKVSVTARRTAAVDALFSYWLDVFSTDDDSKRDAVKLKVRAR